jgi:hypothetical protein
MADALRKTKWVETEQAHIPYLLETQ